MEKDLTIQMMHVLESKKKAFRDKAKQEGRQLTEAENLVILTLDELAFDFLEYMIRHL